MPEEKEIADEGLLGLCPECHSENIDYRDGGVKDYIANLYYSFICLNCGVEGEEHYTVEYSHTTYRVKESK